jgi:hypothetical protein
VSKPDIAAIDMLVNVVSRPGSVRRFRQDPEGTVREAGADPEALRDVIDFMAELTPAELRLVSDLNRVLVEAGFKADDGTVGIV